mgnify:CR=1 FL=1
MDMHEAEPREVKAGATEETLNEAPATADGAGIDAAAAADASEATAEEMVSEAVEEQQEEEAAPVKELTCESLLDTVLALMAKDPSEYNNEELNRLRLKFSMLHSEAAVAQEEAAEEKAEEKAAEEAAVAASVENELSEDAGEPTLRQQFDAAIAELRSRKAAWSVEQEAKRAANLERKNAIIAEIIALAEDTDNVNRTFPRYRELQDEFNGIGDVDPTEETGVWKRFQDAREQYSDNLKINKELRDYDFKKNLAEKESLLSEARLLTTEEDVIAAYRRLQDLHNKWRQIGPVAKELRDDIWNRFREASAEINKRYQAFFEARKAREAENEAAKTALCERLEAIDMEGLKTFNAWEQATEQVLELQKEWKTLGFASKKQNRTLFARFRGCCDAFFAAKAEFFRNTRDELNRNLARKQQLAEEAEALSTSTEWKKATDRFVEMQKEWRTIGAVPKKYSDALWKRFTTACDAFFDAKKKASSGTRAIETANLKTKREIVGKLSALITGEDIEKSAAMDALRELQARWNETGHVPFREKDKLYAAYRDAVDAVRRHFDMAERGARKERFAANVAKLEGDDDKVFREREKLLRAAEARRNELRTYENNLGFLSSRSKSGDSLVKDMERRIERLKEDIREILDKVKILDEKIS